MGPILKIHQNLKSNHGLILKVKMKNVFYTHLVLYVIYRNTLKVVTESTLLRSSLSTILKRECLK